MLVAILDSQLRHLYCSNLLPPLTPADVIGEPVWKYVDAKDIHEIQTRLSRCLALGETQRYWVSVEIGGERVTFRVKADRLITHGIPLVVCVSYITPGAARELSDTDVKLIGLLMRKAKQSDIAAELGITQSAVSRREREIRNRLGLNSREDLLHLAVSME